MYPIIITRREYQGQIQSPAVRVGVHLLTAHLLFQIWLQQLPEKTQISYSHVSALAPQVSRVLRSTPLIIISHLFFQWFIQLEFVRVLIHNVNCKVNFTWADFKAIGVKWELLLFFHLSNWNQVFCEVLLYHALCSLGNNETWEFKLWGALFSHKSVSVYVKLKAFKGKDTG